MADPFDYLPYALAARGGTVDGIPAPQLVAAGLTLLQRSAPLVRALQGRRAAILLPTSPAFITALAASEGRGAVLVNPLAAPVEIAAQLGDANAGAAFTTAALAARLPAGMTAVLLDDAPHRARVISGGTTSDLDLGSHFGLDLQGTEDARGANEECAVVYTSGMAGRPLGAILTHRNLIANARSTVAAAAMTRDDHVLALLPWSHLFGLTVTASAPLFSGARITTVERFSSVRAAGQLARGDVTAVVGVPAVFRAILAALERRGNRRGEPRLGALRLAICGGAVLPPDVQDRWHAATGVELRQGYGLTEAAPVCLFNRVDRANVRGSLGHPLPGVEIAILAERSDTPVAPGTEGEIAVRGSNVFRGYVSGGDAGLRVTSEGWLRTGDLGAAQVNGTVEFRGLCKAMFTRNGFNVYPREIEAVVGAMPGVRAVHVGPVPEPSREHDVSIEVHGAVTVDQVREWCDARLSAYKRPSRITIRR